MAKKGQEQKGRKFVGVIVDIPCWFCNAHPIPNNDDFNEGLYTLKPKNAYHQFAVGRGT